jgi:hypothetical protein
MGRNVWDYPTLRAARRSSRTASAWRGLPDLGYKSGLFFFDTANGRSPTVPT